MISADETVLAIDPGAKRTGFVEYRGGRPIVAQIAETPEAVVAWIEKSEADYCVIELPVVHIMKTADGHPYAPKHIGETFRFIGRFENEWNNLRGFLPDVITRAEVRKHLTGKATRVGDKHVRAAILERYGGEAVAKGRKAEPGPLYGIAGDMWAALGVAITYVEKNELPF